MSLTKLQQYLDENHVRYTTVAHSLAFTSQELANLTHTSGRAIAKTVMVKYDGGLAMLVLPAHLHVDLEAFAAAVESDHARLALEHEFKTKFPDCETGAMPPFGNLYDLPVYVDELLAESAEIAFNAGSHREMIRLAYTDFQKLVKPKLLKFAAAHAHA